MWSNLKKKMIQEKSPYNVRKVTLTKRARTEGILSEGQGETIATLFC